jgi:hypothetical protein
VRGPICDHDDGFEGCSSIAKLEVSVILRGFVGFEKVLEIEGNFKLFCILELVDSNFTLASESSFEPPTNV